MHSSTELAVAKRRLLDAYLRGELQRPGSAPIRRSSAGTAPLAPSQEAVWRSAQQNPSGRMFNESITIHRHGPIDLIALQRSMLEVIRRHEAWGTTFEVVDGTPLQIVQAPPDTLTIPLIDLRHVPEPLRIEEARTRASTLLRELFDLERGPLWRAMLFRLDEAEYQLFVCMHQIIVDGVSVYNVLMPELVTAYEAFSRNETPVLRELPVQYVDFSRWQNETRAHSFPEQIEYWRKQLTGAPFELCWPATPRPPYETFRGEIQPFAMTKDLSDSIRDFSEAEHVTRFAFVVATFVALLQGYTAQQEIVLGTVAPVGRDRTEVQHLLGYFLNPVALRIAVAKDASFRTLLRHTSEVISDALSNAEVPFEKLVQELDLDRDPSRHPVFQVAVSMEPLMRGLDSWDLTPMDLQSGGARWDLYLVTDARPEGILVRVQYNPDLFDQQAITALMGDLCQVSEIVIRHPDLPLSSLLNDAVLSRIGSS